MMKVLSLILCCLFLNSFLFAQNTLTQRDSIATYFAEIKAATAANRGLWNKDLYGAILLVDPQTRAVYCNENDSTLNFLKMGGFFKGDLAKNINIANTATKWGSKTWAMVMLPLPSHNFDRVNLLAHELFHKAQPELGLEISNSDNNHLDQKEGRVYLRLELEALKKALRSLSEKEIQEHLSNAFAFRKYRHGLFPGADSSENKLELNEGLAEYTGLMLSGRTEVKMKEHLINSINEFFSNPTYVRSFAYQTIPVYGYFLNGKNHQWNMEVNTGTMLDLFLLRSLKISLAQDLSMQVHKNRANYNGAEIERQETEREERAKKLLAEYRKKFITQSHFELVFEKMNVSFDPRNIVPLDNKGTVYPNIRVTDNWGILNVTGGALMSSNWDKIILTKPSKTDGPQLLGEGWTLDLADGYIVDEDAQSGNYNLKKKKNSN